MSPRRGFTGVSHTGSAWCELSNKSCFPPKGSTCLGHVGRRLDVETERQADPQVGEVCRTAESHEADS